MQSRERILKAIQQNKPTERYMAIYTLPENHADNLGELYKSALERNGGAFFKADSTDEVETILSRSFPGVARVSLVEGISGSRNLDVESDPHGLADVEVAVVRGVVGVAEN